MVPLGTLLRVENSTGPVSVMRYNMYTSAAVNGVPAPGVSSGTVVQEMTRLAQRAGRALRVDRDDLPPGPGRQRRLPHLRPGDGAGVPGAGGQVRELAAAAGGHPGRAHVSAGRGHGHGHRPPAGGHLRADRFPGAGRPGLQERHPDRRVRARAAAAGRGAARGDAGRPPGSVSGRSS